MKSEGKTYLLRVRPTIPKALKRLEDIASNLWFAWNSDARGLFRQMDPILWVVCGHNPRAFLRRVSQHRLDEMASDRSFLSQYHGVVSDFDSYMKEEHQWYTNKVEKPGSHEVAYFSAEFGIHESLPIYSGGLGILSGDHCKSASDLGLPFTAVGLLYRQGYFTQTINTMGQQVAVYHDNRFGDLCIEPALGDDGKEVVFHLATPECKIDVKVWIAQAGHIRLVLLDTDLPQNGSDCRGITNQLYGGGIDNRIKQEVVLGIGGVRALRLLGVTPTVWHANEGHAAFIIIERIRELVADSGLSFEVALEAVRSCTVFTTHTPVPAGHDIFPLELFDRHMSGFAGLLGVSTKQLHELGSGDFGHGAHGFNQTALSIHGASYVNGVAKLHGEVSSVICQSMWPDLTPEENPVTSVTNGVHVATWLAPEWISAFNQHLGGQWRGHMLDPDYWENVQEIPDYLYWSIHQTNKQRMLVYVREQLERQARRNGESAYLVQAMTAHFDVRTLVVGFARRFATYKRATLLFHDEARLLRILTEAKRPIVFLFAGKAHPADKPGQELIRRIHELARKPEFVGRILMLEGYDMTLGRYLTSGVDVWLNNPIRPMEASGTSGMKAAMNGVPNLSILDGWWPEGFQGDNGWAIGGERDIEDEDQRNEDDAASLYHLLQRVVAPTYYRRNESGFSDEWVGISKRAMISSIPHFNTDRMVAEYTERFYVPASEHGKRLAANTFKHAKALAEWKAKVRKSWSKISLHMLSGSDSENEFDTTYGKELQLSIKVDLDSLSADDVQVEVMLLRPTREGGFKPYRVVGMEHTTDGVYQVNLLPDDSGDFAYHIRAYPTHADLAHPLTMGLMTYL